MQYVPPVRRVKQLNVAPAVKEVSVVADAGTSPHAPVRLLLQSAPRKISPELCSVGPKYYTNIRSP